AHDVPNRIVGTRTGREPIRYHPDSLESLRIFDHLWCSVSVFLLNSFPRRGRLVDVAISGNQLKIKHLLLLFPAITNTRRFRHSLSVALKRFMQQAVSG